MQVWADDQTILWGAVVLYGQFHDVSPSRRNGQDTAIIVKRNQYERVEPIPAPNRVDLHVQEVEPDRIGARHAQHHRCFSLDDLTRIWNR